MGTLVQKYQEKLNSGNANSRGGFGAGKRGKRIGGQTDGEGSGGEGRRTPSATLAVALAETEAVS